MATEIYLGKPPVYIEEWIKAHSQPAGHPETRFTLEDGTVESYEIIGTLDNQWLSDNGFVFDHEWNKNITSIDIGTTVTSISATFEGCSSLTNVTIGNGVTSIGSWAFYGCSGLTSVTIPDSVTSIGFQAFWGCSGLMSVTGNGVTSIGNYAFQNCSNLTNATFQNVISIGDSAFVFSGLTNVTVPDNITSIEEWAFSQCNITTVTIIGKGGNANNVKQMIVDSIGDAEVSDNITWNMPS